MERTATEPREKVINWSKVDIYELILIWIHLRPYIKSS
jgi:hypothetical protein